MDQTLWEDSRLPSPDDIGNNSWVASPLKSKRDAEGTPDSIERFGCTGMEVCEESLTGPDGHAHEGALHIGASQGREVCKVGDGGIEGRGVDLRATVETDAEFTVRQVGAHPFCRC